MTEPSTLAHENNEVTSTEILRDAIVDGDPAKVRAALAAGGDLNAVYHFQGRKNPVTLLAYAMERWGSTKRGQRKAYYNCYESKDFADGLPDETLTKNVPDYMLRWEMETYKAATVGEFRSLIYQAQLRNFKAAKFKEYEEIGELLLQQPEIAPQTLTDALVAASSGEHRDDAITNKLLDLGAQPGDRAAEIKVNDCFVLKYPTKLRLIPAINAALLEKARNLGADALLDEALIQGNPKAAREALEQGADAGKVLVKALELWGDSRTSQQSAEYFASQIAESKMSYSLQTAGARDIEEWKKNRYYEYSSQLRGEPEGYEAVARLLLGHKQTIKSSVLARALEVAIEKNLDADFVRSLRRRGARINAQNSDGDGRIIDDITYGDPRFSAAQTLDAWAEKPRAGQGFTSSSDVTITFPAGGGKPEARFTVPINLEYYTEQGYVPPKSFMDRLRKGGEISISMLNWGGAHITNVATPEQVSQWNASAKKMALTRRALSEKEWAAIQANSKALPSSARSTSAASHESFGYLETVRTPDGEEIVIDRGGEWIKGTYHEAKIAAGFGKDKDAESLHDTDRKVLTDLFVLIQAQMDGKAGGDVTLPRRSVRKL